MHGKFENYSQKISTFRPFIINPAAQSPQKNLSLVYIMVVGSLSPEKKRKMDDVC